MINKILKYIKEKYIEIETILIIILIIIMCVGTIAKHTPNINMMKPIVFQSFRQLGTSNDINMLKQ